MSKKTLIIMVAAAVLFLAVLWGSVTFISLRIVDTPEPTTEATATPIPGISADNNEENRYQGDVKEITDTEITVEVSGRDMTFQLTEKTAQHIPLLEIGVGDNIIVEVEPGSTTVKLFEKVLSETKR